MILFSLSGYIDHHNLPRLYPLSFCEVVFVSEFRFSLTRALETSHFIATDPGITVASGWTDRRSKSERWCCRWRWCRKSGIESFSDRGSLFADLFLIFALSCLFH